MKNRFAFILVCIILAGFFIFKPELVLPTNKNTEPCHIYFVDRQLHRLIPTTFAPEKTTEKTVYKIISELISGRDENSAILRIIPKSENGISAKVVGDTVYVNLSSELSDSVTKNAETEKLFIYQIVYSLTSINGIDYVRFTIDSESRKYFLGFLDMREIFTANYDI